MSDSVASTLATLEPSGVVGFDFTGVIHAEPGSEIEAIALIGKITETQIEEGAITTPLLAANAVTAAKIQAETITATQIKAGTITATQIAVATIEAINIKAHTITAEKIAAATITAEEIAAHTITATQIAAATITSKEIAAETITGGNIKAETITAHEIAANTITAGQIAAGTILGGNIAAGTVTAGNITIAELSALSANLGAITAGTVTGATIRTGAAGKRVVLDPEGIRAYSAGEALVLNFSTETGNLAIKGKVEAGSEVPATTITGQLTNAQVKELEAAKITGTIVETQIGNEAISTGKIKAANVTTAKLAAEAITAEKIAAGTITATQIAAATITGEKIAATTIETGNLKAESVTAAKIAAGTITATQIAAGTITGEKIAAGTITAAKLSVSELSAITANLGTVTAGKITGAEITSLSKFTLVEPEGVALSASTLGWVEAGKETKVISIAGRRVKAEKDINHILEIKAPGSGAETGAELNLRGVDRFGSGGIPNVGAIAGLSSAVLLNGEGASSFLQLIASAKVKINFGIGKLTFAASRFSSLPNIAHGLGVVPKVVIATALEGTFEKIPIMDTFGWSATEFFAAGEMFTAFTGTREFCWIAIG
jgi:hypothetical protein